MQQIAPCAWLGCPGGLCSSAAPSFVDMGRHDFDLSGAAASQVTVAAAETPRHGAGDLTQHVSPWLCH